MTVIRSAENFGTFRCTAELVTAESCEAGDVAERGYVDCWGQLWDDYSDSSWDLRDLLDTLQGRSACGDGSNLPSWVTFDSSTDDLCCPQEGWRFLLQDSDAIHGQISVHRPAWISDASWLRVLALLGWRPRRFDGWRAVEA